MKRIAAISLCILSMLFVNGRAQQPVQPEYMAPENNHIAAQRIVEQILAQHKEIGIAAIHATKPGESVSKVIAINRQRIGRPSDDDDLQTLATGVEQIFLFPVNTDVDGATFVSQAKQIRDDLQPRLHSVSDLFQPID